MKRRFFTVIMLAIILLGSAPVAHAVPTADSAVITAAPVATGSASSVIKNFYGQLADAMKDGEQLGFGGRVKKLQPAVKAAFDLPYMTRLSVGSVWSQATPDEQKQLISAFSDFSVANYAHNFAKYNGEQFDVVDEKPIQDGAIVETTLKPKDKDPIALNYLMHKDDQGNWRIVDVYLNGSISELATRRSEFSSIANRDGIPALVNSLGEKSKSMGPS